MGKFQRNNPPTFKGRYDPEGAHAWLRDIEKVFRVMVYTKAQKVQFGAHMLTEEDDDLWGNTCQRLEVAGNEITWAMFKGEFMKQYFPKDICGKKEIEFLELKQRNSTIVEYAAKFEELMKLCPYYNDAAAEVSKCIKFKNRFHPEIK